MKLTTLIALTVLALGTSADVPFYMLRLRAPETEDLSSWAKLRDQIAKYPGCCDEVWFSTGIGYPPLEYHRKCAVKQAKAAADLRALNIQPGLQIQATLGHGDEITKTCSVAAMNWGGFTGEKGIVCKYCSCPRQPQLLQYFAEVVRIYAQAYQPSSIWIDDDLRINNHEPAIHWSDHSLLPGCWCPLCVGEFAKREGKTYTRETLSTTMHKDSALYDRWETFQFEALVELARVIAQAVHEVSPQTHMGYQHCAHRNNNQLLIYKAMAQATGLKVRSRPGGGAYFDHIPYGQIDKAYFLAGQRAMLEPNDIIEQYCPEVETCPRTFSCRTPRGVLLEAIENLALSMDSVSLFILNTKYDPAEWFGRRFFSELVANREMLLSYSRTNEGTLPAGLYMDHAPKWQEYTAGVPLVTSYGIRLGAYTDLIKANKGKPIDMTSASGSQVLQFAHLADTVCGGKLPVMILDPVQAFIMPRLTPAGILKTFVMVNTTIDFSDSIRVKLRGVKTGVTKAIWHALDEKPIELPLEKKENAEAVLTLPALAAWSAAWVEFK